MVDIFVYIIGSLFAFIVVKIVFSLIYALQEWVDKKRVKVIDGIKFTAFERSFLNRITKHVDKKGLQDLKIVFPTENQLVDIDKITRYINNNDKFKFNIEIKHGTDKHGMDYHVDEDHRLYYTINHTDQVYYVKFCKKH